jgi:hypothetical protein
LEDHIAGGEFDSRDGFIKVEGSPISGDFRWQYRFNLQEGHRQGSTELSPPAQEVLPAQFLRFRVASCKEKFADSGYGLPRGRIYVVVNARARPQGTLCQVEPLSGRASEDHGTEPAIAYRQGLQPPICWTRKPYRRLLDFRHSQAAVECGGHSADQKIAPIRFQMNTHFGSKKVRFVAGSSGACTFTILKLHIPC